MNIAMEKGLDLLLGLGKEVGGEFIAEIATDYILGPRRHDQTLREQVVGMIKSGDKAGLQPMLEANILGMGQADEQIFEEDLGAVLASGQVPELVTLGHFFARVLTVRERTTYRKGHCLQKDPHIRRRNLVILHDMADDAARRQYLIATGKLDANATQKVWDFVTETSPQLQTDLAVARRAARTAKAEALAPRPGFFRRTFGR